MRYQVKVSNSYHDGRLFRTVQADLPYRQALAEASKLFDRDVAAIKASGYPVTTQDETPFSWQISSVRQAGGYAVPYSITYIVCKDN